MESNQKKKWLSDIHQYEWYKDTKGRVWVVTGFWYENEVKDKIILLQMGTSHQMMQPYLVVQQEISAGRMKIISVNI